MERIRPAVYRRLPLDKEKLTKKIILFDCVFLNQKPFDHINRLFAKIKKYSCLNYLSVYTSSVDNNLDYLHRKHSKNGLTLLELLVVITLIFVVSAVLLKITFPKEEDLRKKGPKEALESVIKMARKVANREAKAVRVRFIDQNMNINIDDKIDPNAYAYFSLKKSNPKHQNSILKFLRETTNSNPKSWPSVCSSNLTKTPLFLVIDTDGKAVFDEDKVCYAIIQNPGNEQLTIKRHKAFEEGYLKSSSTASSPTWRKKDSISSRQYFTVYPSGLCDYVSFKAEKCPQYNHNYVVDPLAGTVKEYK
jgi:Tfp pilus assembly protein FimT